jgi:hypothetical protein
MLSTNCETSNAIIIIRKPYLPVDDQYIQAATEQRTPVTKRRMESLIFTTLPPPTMAGLAKYERNRIKEDILPYIA